MARHENLSREVFGRNLLDIIPVKVSSLILILLLPFVLLGTHKSYAKVTPLDLYTINTDSIIKNAPLISDYKTYPFVYLLDEISIAVNDNFTYTETIHQIKLIMSQEGIGQTGSIVINYLSDYDSVFINSMRSIGPDGTEYPVADSTIIRGISPSNLMNNDLYSDQRQVRINFQGLRVGSILEAKYTIKRHRVYFGGISTGFYFRDYVPSKIGIFSVKYPASLMLYTKTYGDGITVHDINDSGYVTRSWRMDGITELPSEDGELTFYDLSTRVEISSFENWRQYSQRCFDSLWAYDLSQPLDSCQKAILSQLGLSGIEPIEKVKKLYYWVQREMRYLGLEMGVNNIRPYSSAVICNKRYGDCKDLTNLLIKLLAAEGISAQPALVSTKIVFNDTSFVAFKLLDHALVFIPNLKGRDYWLDPTLNYAPVGFTYPDVHDKMAITLGPNPECILHIPLNSPMLDRKEGLSNISIDTTGRGTGNLSIRYSGLTGVMFKQKIARLNREELDNMIHSFAPPTGRYTEYQIRGLDDYDSAITFELTLTDDNYADKVDRMLILTCNSASLEFDNSGALETRTTDLYLGYTPSFLFQKIITFPAEFDLKYLPSNVDVNCETFLYQRTYERRGERQIVIIDIAEVKNPFVPVSKYNDYRSALVRMKTAMRDKILLERNKDN